MCVCVWAKSQRRKKAKQRFKLNKIFGFWNWTEIKRKVKGQNNQNAPTKWPTLQISIYFFLEFYFSVVSSAMLAVWLYSFLGLTTLVASSTNNVFTNSFLVRFHRSIENDIAHEIAVRNGFENVGEVIHFGKIFNWFLFDCDRKKLNCPSSEKCMVCLRKKRDKNVLWKQKIHGSVKSRNNAGIMSSLIWTEWIDGGRDREREMIAGPKPR